MVDTERHINELRQLLGCRTIMSFAPAVRQAWSLELDQLVIQHRTENALSRQIEEQMKVFRDGLTESVAVEASKRKADESSRFFLSSFLLTESFAYLHRQPEESLHLVTGVTIGKTRTVETVVPVALAKATVVAAEADGAALSQILATLDRLGHALTGVFHIHPGNGIETTIPSSVDRNYMKRLSGRSLVFGIWSRDGYCRVLTVPGETKVQLYGDGITEIGKDHDAIIYKLNDPGKSLLGFNPRPAEKLAVARIVVRPSGADRKV